MRIYFVSLLSLFTMHTQPNNTAYRDDIKKVFYTTATQLWERKNSNKKDSFTPEEKHNNIMKEYKKLWALQFNEKTEDVVWKKFEKNKN